MITRAVVGGCVDLENAFNAGKHRLKLGKKTYIMGILNVTPDSFSDGGMWQTREKAIIHAIEMEEQGADVIDIGAQSTRPGHTKISADEELKRLIPVLESISSRVSVPISVDTFYPSVAKEALNFGASIINDVNGFKDEKMFEVAKNSDCGCVIMYDGKNEMMVEFFEKQLKTAEQWGIDKTRICFDPGIGFGKTHDENLFIIRNLKDFKIDGCAMLVGASKKRIIGECDGNSPVEERRAGTIATHTLAIANGADIIRVHEVEESRKAARVADAILRGEIFG